MTFLISKAFQNNQTIIMRAFSPGTWSSCRNATSFSSTPIINGFNFNAINTGRRDYYKWTKPTTTTAGSQLQLKSKSKCGCSSVISKRQSSSGDHVTLWTAERILSGALVPLVPLAFLVPSAPLEAMLAFGFTLHSHWGIEAIVVDYVRPSVFGETIPKLALAAVYGLSAMTLGGLLYFIYADVGIVTAIKMLWKL